MSALEDLIARFQRDLYKPEREQLRRAELEAMNAYNRIAHELAERIRAQDVIAISDDAPEIFARAANLIDPEVSDG